MWSSYQLMKKTKGMKYPDFLLINYISSDKLIRIKWSIVQLINNRLSVQIIRIDWPTDQLINNLSSDQIIRTKWSTYQLINNSLKELNGGCVTNRKLAYSKLKNLISNVQKFNTSSIIVQNTNQHYQFQSRFTYTLLGGPYSKLAEAFIDRKRYPRHFH